MRGGWCCPASLASPQNHKWGVVYLRPADNYPRLICQPHTAHPCWSAARVPNPTRWRTRTRRRPVLLPWASRRGCRGSQRGFGAGPVAWRRAGCPHLPACGSKAVMDSRTPSVTQRGPRGARTPGGPDEPCPAPSPAGAPPARASRSWVTGARAVDTPWGDRARRLLAALSVPSPAWTALSQAHRASHGRGT